CPSYGCRVTGAGVFPPSLSFFDLRMVVGFTSMEDPFPGFDAPQFVAGRAMSRRRYRPSPGGGARRRPPRDRCRT
ncbi:hypothetical protein ABLN79_17135, partial [Mycobacterium tuberculosis]